MAEDILQKLTKRVIKFRNERDWRQFHTPKDLAIDLSLEASEVLEHFLWKNDAEIKKYLREHKAQIGDEIMDVLHVILLMVNELGIDVAEAFEKKMKENERKYPIAKARGNHTKHTEL